MLLVQVCSYCHKIYLSDKVGVCLCSTDERILVKKAKHGKHIVVLHRLRIQRMAESKFVNSVNRILVGDIKYVQLRGKINERQETQQS